MSAILRLGLSPPTPTIGIYPRASCHPQAPTSPPCCARQPVTSGAPSNRRSPHTEISDLPLQHAIGDVHWLHRFTLRQPHGACPGSDGGADTRRRRDEGCQSPLSVFRFPSSRRFAHPFLVSSFSFESSLPNTLKHETPSVKLARFTSSLHSVTVATLKVVCRG